MVSRPCPTCRKPTPWEGNAWKPFCSERCKIQDLGAWASESYRVTLDPGEGMPFPGEARPEEGDDEGWTGEPEG